MTKVTYVEERSLHDLSLKMHTGLVDDTITSKEAVYNIRLCVSSSRVYDRYHGCTSDTGALLSFK